MRNLQLFEKPREIESHFKSDSNIVLYHGDVNDFLKTVPDNSVSLIVSSPPYNLGKEYEKEVAINEYLETQTQTVKQFHRI